MFRNYLYIKKILDLIYVINSEIPLNLYILSIACNNHCEINQIHIIPIYSYSFNGMFVIVLEVTKRWK